MRELHVVAVSEDGRHVVLATTPGATKGGFRVALDERLTAAVRGELLGPQGQEPKGGDLTPKEIQTRLREGESAESIALSAGVPVSRVERFSGPVQGEMARIIDAARTAHLIRSRRGASLYPLGTAVDRVLDQGGAQPAEAVEWSARREEGGTWVVTVSWFARARTRTASWRYDPASKTVTGLDPASAAMAYVDPDAPAPGASRRTAKSARTAAAKSTTTARPKRAKPAAAKPTKPVARAKQVVKAKPVAKAQPAPKPVVKAKPAAATSTARTAKPAKPQKTTAAPSSPPTLRIVPNPPPRAGAESPAKSPAKSPGKSPAKSRAKSTSSEQRDGVRSRASVPGWADVLLGASPRTNPPAEH